jgi:hypothetical protein
MSDTPPMEMGIRFDRFARAHFLRLLAEGHSRTAAAKRLGFQRRTVTSRMQRDPEFALQVLEAEGEVLDEIESVVYEKARKGHVEAAKFVLERRDPTRWGPLSARQAITAGVEQKTPEELSEIAVGLIRTIIERERRTLEVEAEAGVIDADSEEVTPVPPVPPPLEGQSELGEVDWDAALDN